MQINKQIEQKGKKKKKRLSCLAFEIKDSFDNCFSVSFPRKDEHYVSVHNFICNSLIASLG